jgi:SNF2 family DNA or RNA helicase
MFNVLVGPEDASNFLILLSFLWVKIRKLPVSFRMAPRLQHSRMQILAGLPRLCQICCHPGTFLENYTGESGKLQHLLDVIHDSLASGRRLLIFSQFTSMLSIIRQALDERRYPYFYIDGHTKPEERVRITERFNEGEHDLCLISLKAGGTGLNLTGADTVILYDLWWNPAVDQQAIDRAHRIGQKNVLQVIRLITEGTIEERIYELQQKKQALIENVIQPGEDVLTGLSEEDMIDLAVYYSQLELPDHTTEAGRAD